MRIDKPYCIHNDLKMICKYHSDGNCMLSVSPGNPPPCCRPFADIIEALRSEISNRAIKVSTSKLPHTHMKAVGTNELEKIIEEVFMNV